MILDSTKRNQGVYVRNGKGKERKIKGRHPDYTKMKGLEPLSINSLIIYYLVVSHLHNPICGPSSSARFADGRCGGLGLINATAHVTCTCRGFPRYEAGREQEKG